MIIMIINGVVMGTRRRGARRNVSWSRCSTWPGQTTESRTTVQNFWISSSEFVSVGWESLNQPSYTAG